MSSDCLKLTIYFGESDRVDGQLLSDVLLDDPRVRLVRPLDQRTSSRDRQRDAEW